MPPMCPRCLLDLQPAQRQGVHLDYCPRCRGIWLDHDEVEKLERLAQAWTHRPSSYAEEAPEFAMAGCKQEEFSQPARRKSFLGQLFDLD